MMYTKIFNRAGLVLAMIAGVSMWPISAARAQSGHGAGAVLLNVVQNDTSNNTTSVTVTAPVSVNGFTVRSGSNRADYQVQDGLGFSDDVDTGVVMVSIAENGRDNGEVTYLGTNYCTPCFDYTRSGGTAGGYWLAIFNAPDGDEYNINVSAAMFPYDRWIAGYARNSGNTNGGDNNLFTGSPGLALGTHFVDNGLGVSTVNLTNLGIDSRTSGVLLVTHGKNEDNYATSMVNSNDGTWTVYVKDNGANQAETEQDPVGFVFVPKTNTMVVSGRFRGDGTRLMFSGNTPAYNVSNTGTGTWRLTIPGHSPGTGVLIVSPEGGFSLNQDNTVSYEPDGDGWIIQSRDLGGTSPSLQTPTSEPVASFVFIPGAPSLSLISPTNNAKFVSNAPDLQVAVSNAGPGNLTVKYYGRPAATNSAPPDFTIIGLPDTQYYTAERYGGQKEMFIAQTEWIITNRVPRNIAYVAHFGDISDSGDIKSGNPNVTEWRNATNAMYRLESPAKTSLPEGIPYGMAVGNHDLEPIGDPTGTSIYYNQYFGHSHFNGRDYYAGRYGTANKNNFFDFFSAGGMDFIVIYFEYDASANPLVLNWANAVLQTNQNRRAIIVTHSLGNTQTPVNFSAQGSAIYNALKANANVFMMLAGHVTGEGSRADTYNGNVIRTFVSDYQGWTNGGNGFLRIIEFSPSNNMVLFQTYSPWADEYKTGPNSEFWFNYSMPQSGPPPAPFSLIGTSSNLSSGSVASLPWPGRQYDTSYEWYVVVTDASNNVTTSPVWRFTTATNSPPVATPMSLTITGDSPTNLTLTASDPNADSLTFQQVAFPVNGLLQNFNAAAGTVTYQPAHGYRGADAFSFSVHDGVFGSSPATVNLNIVAPADANANGLPDAWETLYGIGNPAGDNDGDGQSNLEEYYANTVPTNAASLLHITSATRAANGHVTLVWPSVGGTRYRVQYSNGGPNGSFTGIFTDATRPLFLEMDGSPYGTPATQTFVDDFSLTGGTPANGARYYRIRLVQ